MKQPKWKITVLVLLASIIVILGIVLCLQTKPEPAPKSSLTLAEFDRQFQRYAKQNDVLKKRTMIPMKGTENRYRYQFTDDFSLIVSVNDDNNVEKVYYYIKKSAWEAKAMTTYLSILIRAVHPEYTDEAAGTLALKMNDIAKKQADQLGFLVDFKEGGYQYITLTKNSNRDLQFFIYLPAV